MDTEILMTELSFKNMCMVNSVYAVPEERLSRAVSDVTQPHPAKSSLLSPKKSSLVE